MNHPQKLLTHADTGSNYGFDNSVSFGNLVESKKFGYAPLDE
jgi:hypothetical protein